MALGSGLARSRLFGRVAMRFNAPREFRDPDDKALPHSYVKRLLALRRERRIGIVFVDEYHWSIAPIEVKASARQHAQPISRDNLKELIDRLDPTGKPEPEVQPIPVQSFVRRDAYAAFASF